MCWGTLPALGISYVLCPLGVSGGHGWVINYGHLGFCKCTPWCLLNDQMTQWCNFQTVSLSLSNCGWNTDQRQRVNVGTTLLTVALLTDIFFLARDPVPDPPWHQTVRSPLWSLPGTRSPSFSLVTWTVLKNGWEFLAKWPFTCVGLLMSPDYIQVV